MPEELFDGIDLTLPDEQLSEWLSYVLEQRVELDSNENRMATIAEQEVALLRRWSREAGPKTRGVAVNFLFWNGPCDWEDLEAWMLDQDREIRGRVFGDLSTFGDSTVGGRLCCSDKVHSVAAIAASAERYTDDLQSISALFELTWLSSDWIDCTWKQADRLLDVDDIDLRTHLVVGYFEDVISEQGWGPDDSHIREWIDGSDGWRQLVLLKVAAWLRLDTEPLRAIAKALTHSRVKEIRPLARGLLGGHLTYGDI